MSTKTIADVRDHLFKLLEKLSDEQKTPDYERMKASCEVAQVMVNTVRLQVDYLKIVHGDGEVPFLEETVSADEEGDPSATLSLFPRAPAEDHPWRQRVHRLGR